jgi:hypothetical protein
MNSEEVIIKMSRAFLESNSRPRMNSKSGNLFCPLDREMQQLMI